MSVSTSLVSRQRRTGVATQHHNFYIYICSRKVLNFDLNVDKRAKGQEDSMASATVKEQTFSDGYNFHTEYNVIIHLHPRCNKCNKYLKEPEEQVYDSLEHEIMEALVVDILDKDYGKYDTIGFDSFMRKWGKVMIPHDCKTLKGLYSRRQMIYIPSTGNA